MDTKASRTTQLARYYRVLFQEENIRYAVIESKERKYDYFFAVFLLSTNSTRALTLEIRDMLAHFYKIHGCLRTSGIILDSR